MTSYPKLTKLRREVDLYSPQESNSSNSPIFSSPSPSIGLSAGTSTFTSPEYFESYDEPKIQKIQQTVKIRLRWIFSSSYFNHRKIFRFITYLFLLVVLALVFYYCSTLSIVNWTYLQEHTTPSYIEVLKSLDYSPQELESSFAKVHIEKSFPISKVHDPRVVPVLYLNSIKSHLKENENSNKLLPDFTVGFKWKDWINFDERLLPSELYLQTHRNRGIQNCEQFEREIGFPARWLPFNKLAHCKNLSPSEINLLKNNKYPHFKINGPDDYKLPVEAQTVIGASYLLHEAPPPQRLLFLTSTKQNTPIGLSIMTDQVHSSLTNPMDHSKESVSLIDEVNELQNMLELNDVERQTRKDSEISIDHSRFLLGANPESFLIPKDISLDAMQSPSIPDLLQKSEMVIHQTQSSQFDKSLDYKQYRNIKDQIDTYYGFEYPKYFHEANSHTNTINGAHFDWRFFNGAGMDTHDKSLTLHKLIRGYMRFANLLSLDSWLAHGSLLGFYFNGLAFGWDFDHDVQITQDSLFRLARLYNQTLIVDTTKSLSGDSPFEDCGTGTYFLDIGSSYFDRRYSKNNAIDARFIDIQTGMFIDITALGPTKSKPKMKDMHRSLKREYNSFLEQKHLDPNDYEHLFNCRNSHYYTHNDISPLYPVLHEGALAYIPNKYEDILIREFPKYKHRNSHEKYTFRNELKLWIPNNICGKGDTSGETCRDKQTKMNYRLTRDYTNKHYEQKELIDSMKDLYFLTSPDSTMPLRIDNVLARIVGERLALIE